MQTLISSVQSRKRSLSWLTASLIGGVLALSASDVTRAQQALPRTSNRARLVCRAVVHIDNAVSCKQVMIQCAAEAYEKEGGGCTCIVKWLGPEVGIRGTVFSVIPLTR